MPPLPERMELCLHNQKGYCKFGEKCIQRHETEICQNRNECTNKECSKRHPRDCKYFSQFGRCKFGEDCAYSHADKRKDTEVETLEKEVKEMKEDTKKVDQLEKEVKELKAEVNNMKLNMARMYKLIKANQVETEERRNEIEKEKDANKKEVVAESKKDSDTKDEKDTGTSASNKKEQTKFKCEQCDYETKKKVTLIKHKNTKHRKDVGANETKGETKEKHMNRCQDCTSCEDCEYLDNNDCEKCDKLFEADIQEFRNKTRA